MEKSPKTNKPIEQKSGADPKKINATKAVFEWLKDNWKKSTILGVGAMMAAPGIAQNEADLNKQALEEIHNKSEIKIDTIQENGQTYIVKKQEFYGEKITNKELENSTTSLEEIKEKYIKREIRAYEPVIINSRFKELREKDFADFTTEESIQYGEKIIKVKIFKEGKGKALIKYIKKAFGSEAERIIKEWGIDENSYEVLGNLKRDQFVRGIVHGQDKEHSRWVYLAGGPESSGTPFIGVVTEQDIFMEGLAGCSGNPVFERVSVDCEDTKVHNSNTK
ncbi:MAG: hypothetical protein PHQ01_01745 [Candidatus Pacebacteria bacterium]|nr:hypothetical protein [Candidatus Paceibacterota bacterium]